MIKLRIYILLATIGCTSNLFAQTARWDSISAISTVNLFCEPGYITAMGGYGNIEPLIFEADIVPYYMLGFNPSSRWGIALSPRVILRMYNKDSYPVRTPSYMPRVVLMRQFVNESKQRDWFCYFSWYHHSNGQDGTFFNADSSGINTQNGSFSTNWVESGFFFSRLKENKKYFLKISAMYSYKQDHELDGTYGRLRFFSDFQSEWNLSKTFKFLDLSYLKNNKILLTSALRVGLIADDLQNAKIIDKKRLIFRYTLTFKPSFCRDVNLFAQYYYGQDYYNIYFNRTLQVLRFGITAKISIFN